MALIQRSLPFALVFLGVSALALLNSPPAASRAPSGWELLGSCSERVEELEAEVATLRRQLAAESSRAAHATALTSSEDELDPEQSQATGSSHSPECAVAFEIADGIKRFKAQCAYALQSTDPCDVPYDLDASGVKRFKVACLRGQ